MGVRKFLTGAATAALFAAGAVAVPAAASAAPSAVEGVCPDLGGVATVYPAAGMSTPYPVDENVNVYVGGSFTWTKGAESEGRIAVDGDFTIDADSGLSNIGMVGVGSGLSPVSGSDIISVGGDFDAAGSTAGVESKAEDNSLLPGNISVGGTATDAGGLELSGGALTQGLGHDAALGEPLASWPDGDFSILSDLIERNVNDTGNVAGTAELQDGGILSLDGLAGKDRYLFTIPAETLNKGAFSLQISDNIAFDATIVIDVTGEGTATVDVQDVLNPDRTSLVMGDPKFGQRSSHILWAFPDASDVTIAGGQVPGSIVVANPASTTTQDAAGTNGRFWVAGNLIHNSKGSEFHAFPFLGDSAFDCGEPPVPTNGDTPAEPTEVAPVEPTVEQAVCTAQDGLTDPTLTLPETEGIDYSVDGPVQADVTVTVTATAKDGYTLADGGDWIVGDDGKTATLAVHFDDVTCDTPEEPTGPVTPGDEDEVAPVKVTVSQSVCTEDGTIVGPIVNRPADTDAIHYTVDGDVKAGGVVTVTAEAQGSHYFSAATGWKLSADKKTATLTVNLDEPQCTDAELVDPADPDDNGSVVVTGDSDETTPGDDAAASTDAKATDVAANTDDEDILAVTGGVNFVPGLAVGGIMLLAGAGAVLLARRRRHQG